MEKSLPKDKIAEYRAAFHYFDKDGDGRITAQELGAVLKKMGQNLTKAEIADLISEVDVDASGAIEFHEFLNMMAKQQSQSQQDKEIMDAFKVFDKNGDGVISAQELRQVMGHMGERLSDKEVEKMIREADQDGDGQINYNEFVRMMKPR